MNRIEPEFIQRVMGPEYQEKVKIYREEKIQERNAQFRKYFRTEKGSFAKSKGDYIRRSKMKEACKDLEWEEKQMIGRFYKNCPKGYEVDHIIPISKGGLHRLCNLQYLTKEENRKKQNK